MNAHALLGHAAALAQVLLIDVTLAGDNAVVIGLAVMGLAPALRRRAVVIGIGLATAIRIGFALVAVRLIAIVGLTLAGGLLLLWVCWRMLRELRAAPRAAAGEAAGGEAARGGTLRRALLQIVLADVSMSLDNVLAVAGAAGRDVLALVTGLVFSVIVTGIAASWVARLLDRHRWIAWVGLAIVLFVALRMIWDGGHEVALQAGRLGHAARPEAHGG